MNKNEKHTWSEQQKAAKITTDLFNKYAKPSPDVARARTIEAFTWIYRQAFKVPDGKALDASQREYISTVADNFLKENDTWI